MNIHLLAEDKVKNRHEIICEYTWGSVPVDKEWAIKSPRYKDTEEKLEKWGFIKSKNIIITKPENKRKL